MIKEFKNGNLHVKLECDLSDIESINPYQVLIDLMDSLDMLDTYLLGEIQTYDNLEALATLYNVRLNKVYKFLLDRDSNTLKSGKTLILKAFTPDESEKQLIDLEY